MFSVIVTVSGPQLFIPFSSKSYPKLITFKEHRSVLQLGQESGLMVEYSVIKILATFRAVRNSPSVSGQPI